MCKKILIGWKNNVKHIAYVINKNMNCLIMQTMGDEIGSCSRPKFVVNHDNNGALDLTSVTDDKIGRNLFTIEEYRPICIRLD